MKNKKGTSKLFLIIIVILLFIYFFSYAYIKNKTSFLTYYLYYPLNYISTKIGSFKNNEILLLENQNISLKLKDQEIIKSKNIVLEEEIVHLKELLLLKNIYTNYEIINATIISRNKSYWFNEIVIDKGSNDGIKVDMAVVTDKGLVGKIVSVNESSSNIKLITNNDDNSKISVKVNTKDGYVHGLITSYDKENNLIVVTGITNYDEVSLNNILYTTGFGIFPEGIPIGEVINIEKDNLAISRILYVKPYQNMNNIKYISVLGNKIYD